MKEAKDKDGAVSSAVEQKASAVVFGQPLFFGVPDTELPVKPEFKLIADKAEFLRAEGLNGERYFVTAHGEAYPERTVPPEGLPPELESTLKPGDVYVDFDAIPILISSAPWVGMLAEFPEALDGYRKAQERAEQADAEAGACACNTCPCKSEGAEGISTLGFYRPECIFAYCPTPDVCREKGCQQPEVPAPSPEKEGGAE